MANDLQLRFLKGSQSNLDALTSDQIQEGAFYLTDDTYRLYIGKNGAVELLNNGVRVVADIKSLPTAPPAKDGDFYYCKTENVFAVYNKTEEQWVQINVDSYVNKVEQTVSKSEKTVTVQTKVSDSNGHSAQDNFKLIEGNDNVTLEAGADTITITTKDEKTTEAGHYTPTTEVQDSKLQASEGKFITGIKRDSKGHIVGVETGAPEEIQTTNVFKGNLVGTNHVKAVSTVNGISDDISFKGDGATTVSYNETDDAIIISSTDSKVTSVDNHYAPAADDNAKLTLDKKILTKVSRDAKGHIVAIDGVETKENLSTAVATDGTVSITATDIFGTQTVDNFKIAAGGDNTISVDDKTKTITITGTDYKATEEGHYIPTNVSTTKSASGGAATAAKATTQVVTGVQVDSKGHIIGVTSAGVQDTHNDVSGVDLTIPAEGKLQVTVKTNDNPGGVVDNIDLAVKYGENKDKLAKLQTDGEFELDVYAKDEVDSKIALAVGANGAVEIVGTIEGAATYPVTGDVKKGDTYIVTSASAVEIYNKLCTAGDMFIASADGKGNAIEWYYVPAGNDIEKFTGSGDSVVLKTGAGDATLGAIKFVNSAADNSNDFNIKPNVVHNSTNGYSETQVSYNLYWGSF